jgi:hypothetical protein
VAGFALPFAIELFCALTQRDLTHGVDAMRKVVVLLQIHWRLSRASETVSAQAFVSERLSP